VSVDETLAAIDAAVGCQQGGRPLDGSVSADFDTEECQTAWHAARVYRAGLRTVNGIHSATTRNEDSE